MADEKSTVVWPEQTTDPQGPAWKVSKPRYNYTGTGKNRQPGPVLPGSGALPHPLFPAPGQPIDHGSPEALAYEHAANLRVFVNVTFERLLQNVRGKAICIDEDYNPVVPTTVKSKTGATDHHVGGETSYAEEVEKDLAYLHGVWSAYGITDPTDEELLEMAGVK